MATPIILADNRFLDGTPTATDTASGYDVLNIRDGKSFTSWKAASSGTKYLTVDAGSAKAVDTLAIFGHNLYTANATVSVESSTTGAWAGEQVERLAGFVPSSNYALLKTFTQQTVRYWRVKIVTASVAAQTAEVMLGARIDFPYPPDTPFVPESVEIESDSSRSKTGQLLGTVVRYKPYTISPTFKYLTRTWVETYFLPFWNSWGSTLTPFFWAWDITLYPNDVRWVTLDPGSSLAPSVTVGAVYDTLAMKMIGVREW